MKRIVIIYTKETNISMESKLNLNTVKEYSEAFTASILDQVYAEKEKLGGQEVLNLTPVRQVNLFVINDLLNKWKAETKKLRSPYFDFESEEVREALQEFMNTLSQHIAIGREQLTPLLEAATQNTLILLLDPQYFYYQVLSNVRYSLNKENIAELFKYVKVNRFFPNALMQHMEREQKDELHASYALWLLDDKSEQLAQEQEDSSTFIHDFSQVVTLQQNTLYRQRLGSAATQPVHTPVSNHQPAFQEPAPSREPVQQELSSGPKTLNDYLNRTGGSTLADIHEKRKIDSIRNNISVNQRFMFVRELFGNNAEEYNQALSTLEQEHTYAEAFNYLRKEYATKYRWRMDSEEVIEFLEIISKRYN